MRDYELVVIFSPNISDDDLNPHIERIGQWVATAGGEVAKVNRWGRNRLAYPINNFREGTYVAYELRLPPNVTQEIERNIKLSEEIIRHLLVRVGE